MTFLLVTAACLAFGAMVLGYLTKILAILTALGILGFAARIIYKAWKASRGETVGL